MIGAAAVFVKVIETEGCQACRMTKAFLDREGVTYETLDGTDPDVKLLATTLGHRQAPVVLVEAGLVAGGAEVVRDQHDQAL